MPRAKHMTMEQWFFLLLSAGVLWLVWELIQPFALVLVGAVIAAIILTPLDHSLSKAVAHNHLRSAIIVTGTLLLVAIPLFMVLIVIVNEASELLRTSFSTGMFERVPEQLGPLWEYIPLSLQEQILSTDLALVAKQAAQWSVENIGALFSSTTKIIINLFLFFMALYYLIAERAVIHKEILAISPLRDSVDEEIIRKIINTTRSVMLGFLLLATVQGSLAAVGMLIFGVPGAVILGALTILASMVPLVGSGLVLVPVVIYLFFASGWTVALGMALWSVIFVGLSDNLLAPYLIKGTTHMHAFLLLLSILGGIHAFGGLGILIGPIILGALLVLVQIYKEGFLT